MSLAYTCCPDSVMGRGTKLWILYASIGLICYSYSLSSNTVYVCESMSRTSCRLLISFQTNLLARVPMARIRSSARSPSSTASSVLSASHSSQNSLISAVDRRHLSCRLLFIALALSSSPPAAMLGPSSADSCWRRLAGAGSRLVSWHPRAAYVSLKARSASARRHRLRHQ